jgi:hypothetical protein
VLFGVGVTMEISSTFLKVDEMMVSELKNEEPLFWLLNDVSN